jgi:TPR repeat protein
MSDPFTHGIFDGVNPVLFYTGLTVLLAVTLFLAIRDLLPERLQHSRASSQYLWARKQARAGNAKACVDCAAMLEKGSGGAPYNPGLARSYTERALNIYHRQARAGSGYAWLKMAEIYNRHHKGHGFADLADRAYHKAWKIHVRQAADGDINAMAYAGYQYRYGMGVIADLGRAAEYLEAAAQAGHGASARSLGDLYLMGFKGKPDPVKAAQLYRHAALQGDIEALERVGDSYFGNAGEANSREQAYFWYARALQRGREAARAKLRRVSENWTPKQLREAQDRLQTWAPG